MELNTEQLNSRSGGVPGPATRRSVKVVKREDTESRDFAKRRDLFRKRFPDCKLTFPGPGALGCATDHRRGDVMTACAVPFFWQGVAYARAIGAQERSQ